jgi:hypothetical protein
VYVAEGNAGLATEGSKVSVVKNLNVHDFTVRRIFLDFSSAKY